jgi:hypothetical protein
MIRTLVLDDGTVDRVTQEDVPSGRTLFALNSVLGPRGSTLAHAGLR